jgi:hypothetical protein
MRHDSEVVERPAAGAPVCEIEITEEMVDAGLPHLYEYNAEFSDDIAILKALFRAMVAASPRALLGRPPTS